MIEVSLGQGRIALIDDCDHELVSKHNWFVLLSGANRSYPYARANISGKKVLLHRYLMSPQPGMLVDHINGNTLDNRRCNLRVCSRAENQWNRRAYLSGSGFKGVRRAPVSGRFIAVIRWSGRKQQLGVFPDAETAAKAYDDKARIVHGAFARLNFPRDGEQAA